MSENNNKHIKTYATKDYVDDALQEINFIDLTVENSLTVGNRLEDSTIGQYSATQGLDCEASGEQSCASGYYTRATGQGAHAEGFGTIASGSFSHAEGDAGDPGDTVASGHGSHAEGCATKATGEYSHTEGFLTEASGQAAHAEGYNTKASGEYQHVIGQSNIEDNANKYAYIVGNGTFSIPSNAHTLDWDGNAWYQGQVQGTNLPHDTRVFEEIEITFDGNTEGKETVLIADPNAPVSLSNVNSKISTSSACYVKMSDKAISYEEFCNTINIVTTLAAEEGEIIESEIPKEEIEQSLVKINDNVFVIGQDIEYGNPPVIVITHENITVDSVIGNIQNDLILTPGIWFICIDVYAYISKFKYQGIISGELKKLDEKFIPDTIVRKEHTHNYLPLSGGTIESAEFAPLKIKNIESDPLLLDTTTDDLGQSSNFFFQLPYTLDIKVGETYTLVSGDRTVTTVCKTGPANDTVLEFWNAGSGIDVMVRANYNGSKGAYEKNTTYVVHMYNPVPDFKIYAPSTGDVSGPAISFENEDNPLGHLCIEERNGSFLRYNSDASSSYTIIDEENYSNIINCESIGAAPKEYVDTAIENMSFDIITEEDINNIIADIDN